MIPAVKVRAAGVKPSAMKAASSMETSAAVKSSSASMAATTLRKSWPRQQAKRNRSDDQPKYSWQGALVHGRPSFPTSLGPSNIQNLYTPMTGTAQVRLPFVPGCATESAGHSKRIQPNQYP